MIRSFRLAVILMVTAAFLYIPAVRGQVVLPEITTVIYDSAATEGYYFMSPYKNMPPYTIDRPLMVLDRYGRIVFYREFPGAMNENAILDFKIQPDGRMSYFNNSRQHFFIMDSTFSVIDSIACVNGYPTDVHDFQIMSNGHYLLFGQETRVMNLTAYHWFGINHTLPGGAAADVTGVVVQEFDANKNLVWEWKGHDHYAFGDVDSIWLGGPNKVDWTHANAIAEDQDGNILLSLRHFDEVTKINRTNGNIIWRMGGRANQFSFPDDPVRYRGQHDIRRINDSMVSLFDNGQYTTLGASRALEYALDEGNRIARKKWQYIEDSSRYSTACGNHQVLGNGNHLIDFGFMGAAFPWMVVVKEDRSRVLDISFPNGYTSYRAFNYLTLPWELHRPAVDCEQIGNGWYLVAEPGHPEYLWSTGATTASVKITDMGDYWVYVPYGDGMISSERIHITDLANPCLYLPAPALQVPVETTLTCQPNPANERAELRFGLPAPTALTLSVMNLQGETVLRVADGFYREGDHLQPADLSHLSPGLYIVSLQTEQVRVVSKLLVK